VRRKGFEPLRLLRHMLLRHACLPFHQQRKIGVLHRSRTCTLFKAAGFKSAMSACSISSTRKLATSERLELSLTGLEGRCLVLLGYEVVAHLRGLEPPTPSFVAKYSGPIELQVLGGSGRNRTCNAPIKNRKLYQLSYEPRIWLGENDSNVHHASSKPAVLPVRLSPNETYPIGRLVLCCNTCPGLSCIRLSKVSRVSGFDFDFLQRSS